MIVNDNGSVPVPLPNMNNQGLTQPLKQESATFVPVTKNEAVLSDIQSKLPQKNDSRSLLRSKDSDNPSQGNTEPKATHRSLRYYQAIGADLPTRPAAIIV